MRRLRTAVIGAGRLGGFHAQKLADHDLVDLLAVVDPLPESRNRVAGECRTTAVADYRELLDGLDAAVIAVPTGLHHKLALDFLNHGIHLLVEKPICSTTGEADELLEAAGRSGVVLQVGHVERFNPALGAAAPHVQNPKYIEAVRASGFTFRSTDVGVVLDLMIHDIDLILALVGSPVRKVEALGLSVLGGHEDVANARIEFESGCVAAISACRVSCDPARRMSIWSPRAFAAIDFATRTTTLVQPSETLLQRRFDVEGLAPEQAEYYREHLAEEHLPRKVLQHEAVDALALELDDFIAAIRTPRRPLVGGQAGRDALAVAEQVLAKIRTHAWDDTADGPMGPMAAPRRRVIPAPHFAVTPPDFSVVRKEAG